MDFSTLSDAVGGLMTDPNKAGLMGLAQGLLASSGASRLPISMGQAMGNGLQGMQQGRQAALQQKAMQMKNQMDQYQIQMMKAGMGLLNVQGSGQGGPLGSGTYGISPGDPTAPPPQPSQPAIPPSPGGLLGSGTFGIPTGGQPASTPQTPQMAAGPAGVSIYGMAPEQLFRQGMALNFLGKPGGGELMSIAVQHDPRLAALMPTDITKMGVQGGMSPEEIQAANRAGVGKANYIPPVNGRPGGYLAYPNGNLLQLPKVPDGFTAHQQPDGSIAIAPLPGGPQAVAASNAAGAAGTALGKAAGTPQTVFNSGTGQPGMAINPFGIQVPGMPQFGGAGPNGQPSSFVPTGPMQGSEKITGANAENYVATQNAVPRVLNAIEGDKNALDLVNKGTFVTGNGSDKKYDWTALAQTWHIPIKEGETADYQLAHKYLANSLSQTANDMGMNGSDARFAAAAQGNPNIETQGPKALADSIRWVAGLKSGVPAYAQAQQQWMAAHNNSPTSLAQFQQTWNKAYDPNVFVTRWLQQRYGNDAAQQWIAEHKLDPKQLAQSYSQIHALGAF